MRTTAILPGLRLFFVALVSLVALAIGTGEQGNAAQSSAKALSDNDGQIAGHAQRMVEEGRQIFRFDTFGSEAFWGDALQLHKAIAGEKTAVSERE